MKPVNLLEFRLSKKVDDELSDTICYECQFCNKIIFLDENAHRMSDRLSGDSFFCSFCIRHGFSTKSNRDVHMYISQIRDLIEVQAITGLDNPVFSYDPDTFMWFVDFTKVGRGKKKLSLEDVTTTIDSILDSLEVDIHITESDILKDRFVESTKKFYSNRYRPINQKQLIPTLKDIAKLTKDEMAYTRNFTPDDLLLRS